VAQRIESLPKEWSAARSARHPRLGAWILLVGSCTLSGCGLLGGDQVSQLRQENARLLSEYRAQRDRVTALQETNADLEARVSEAEKMLARNGQSLPAASRISRVPQRGSTSGSALAGAGLAGAGAGVGASGSVASPPPYVPPAVPSLPAEGSSGDIKWRPARRP